MSARPAMDAAAQPAWARALNAATAAALVCLLLAAASLLGHAIALPPVLGPAVHGITPGLAIALACIAIGRLLSLRARPQPGPQAALGGAALILAVLPQLPGLVAAAFAELLGQASPLMATGVACGSLSLLAPRARHDSVLAALLLRWLPALALTVIALLGIVAATMGPQSGELWLASYVVSPGPACAFLLLTVCLLHDGHERAADRLPTLREDFRISIMSLMVLTAVVVVTGIATFWAVQARLQESEQERLVQSAYRREMAFNYQLANASRLAADLAQPPPLAKALAAWPAPAAAASLKDELAAMWRDEFNAIRFERADGAAGLPWRGDFLPTDLPGVALEQASEMLFELQWNDGLVAYARVPVMQAGRVLGWVVSQQRLQLMTEQLFETADLGPHVEVRLCTPHSAAVAWCMPSRVGEGKTMLSLRTAQGTPSAIAQAIRGEQGAMLSADEKGTPVIDVYASVQRPLGLQLRQSIDAVTAPVREKLKQVFVVIGVMLAAGLVILNLQVRPLALRLVLNERRLSTVMGNVSDGIVTTDRQGRITYLNRAAERLTGWALANAVGKPVSEVYRVVDAATGQPALRIVEQVLNGGAPRDGSEIDLLRHPHDARLPVTDTVSLLNDRNNAVAGAVLVFHDASAARARAAAISYEASHDALTGLINRKEFERRLSALAAPADDASADLPHLHSLLYIDLDKFKQVNDSAGHAAGDELLRRVTRLMHKSLRASDMLARVGGDEFSIILPGCAPHVAQRIADQIRQAVAAFAFDWNGLVFHVGTSIGVVSFESGYTDLATLVSTADAACYRAKSAGRNNVQVHEGVLGAAQLGV